MPITGGFDLYIPSQYRKAGMVVDDVFLCLDCLRLQKATLGIGKRYENLLCPNCGHYREGESRKVVMERFFMCKAIDNA